MKLRWLPVLALVCLWLGGCECYSLYPLYTQKDAVVEPALEGTWMGTETDDKSEITFSKSKNGGYEFSIFDPSTKIKTTYDANLVQLAGALFMDIRLSEETLNGASVDQPLGMVPMHEIVKVKISADDLAYATLEEDSFKGAKPDGGTGLKHETLDKNTLFPSVVITAETEDLRRYIAAHAEDGFSQFEHLKRVTKTGN